MTKVSRRPGSAMVPMTVATPFSSIADPAAVTTGATFAIAAAKVTLLEATLSLSRADTVTV